MTFQNSSRSSLPGPLPDMPTMAMAPSRTPSLWLVVDCAAAARRERGKVVKPTKKQLANIRRAGAKRYGDVATAAREEEEVAWNDLQKVILDFDEMQIHYPYHHRFGVSNNNDLRRWSAAYREYSELI